MTSQEGGVAALEDAGSERIVIEDSDEEMQISMLLSRLSCKIL